MQGRYRESGWEQQLVMKLQIEVMQQEGGKNIVEACKLSGTAESRRLSDKRFKLLPNR